MMSRSRLLVLLGVSGIVLLGMGGWIQLKAVVAQALIAHAWTDSQATGAHRKPWPWADTWPVARLTVPDLGQSLYVLAGDSGRVLAFGPGWSFDSAPPGRPGTTLISGHRDTHFRFLSKLAMGERIELTVRDRRTVYRVTALTVIDSRTQHIRADATGRELVLVTCYPFDALVPGGPLRYVVQAESVEGE